jgi:hypothetical protein
MNKKSLKEINIYSYYIMSQSGIKKISHRWKNKIIEDRDDGEQIYTDEKLCRMIKKRIAYLATQGLEVWYEHIWFVEGDGIRTDDINDILIDLEFLQHTIECM